MFLKKQDTGTAHIIAISGQNTIVFIRRIKARLGSEQAIVATAPMLAHIVYRMLNYTVEYQAIRAEEYEQSFREREIRYLQRKTARPGFTL